MGRRPGSRTVHTEADRLANYQAMVERGGPEECWPWTGSVNDKGYGKFYDGKRYRSAANFGYEALIGPIPEGLEINHSCNAHGCQNPAHWLLDTHAVNLAEMRERTGWMAPPRMPRLLSPEQEQQVRIEYATGEWSLRRLAVRHGVGKTTIEKTIKRHTDVHGMVHYG